MINNIEILAFIRENLSFARTIVIKNENLALSDNALMKSYYGLDSGSDKSKWRYYLNLNGEYHITDEMMTVKSLDDNEMIDFTKANLENHPATKKAYRLGGYYFSRLNAQYPHQADLIQGIINPIPPEEAVAANNFQILRYTKEYVNWNETQLIPALQDDIYKNFYQMYDTEYLYTDNLMAPALIGVIEKCVFEFLLECRFENRQTRYAHPFYIWSYLQSKGISSIYKDLLNNKQTMWLFRNIDYALRNLGKEKTFQELIEILLTERNISLSKYDLVLSTENLTTTLKPEPYYASKRLNLTEEKGSGEGLHKVSTVMLKENPESLDNEINYSKFLSATEQESAFSEQSTFPIKILDSELVDTTSRKQETIYSILTNEVIYLAGKDLYNINLDIEDPITGIHHRLTVKESIVLWHYMYNRSIGQDDCDNIPSFYYQNVLRATPPTLDMLMSTGTKPFINEVWCSDVLKTYIPQIRIISPSTFYENGLAIFNLRWTHEKMYSRWRSIGYVAQRKNAISAMYETGFVALTDAKTYTEFLSKFDFEFDNYTKEDFSQFMWNLWQKMTGWDQFTHITVGQVQSGMIGLMKFLSSYSVQYVYQTVAEDGWYEGGIDLLTENPISLNHKGDERPELEQSVNVWLPVHHRAVTEHEEEAYYFMNNSFEYWDVITDMTESGSIYQTPLLYDLDEDPTGDDDVTDVRVIDMSYKVKGWSGELPYNLEDLIPTGGTRASEHVLKEMIVDTFEGITTIGPWTVTDIIIVDNNLDNSGVAKNVDGYNYAKIVKTEGFTKDGVAMNRYYVGFVPALLESQVIKLDLIATSSETNETLHVRFDYNIVSKQNTWSISFEIPQSVKPEIAFEITPTITGLTLGSVIIAEESYVVDSSITDYLSVDYSGGKITGTFLKAGWPSELPVVYVLTTKDGNSDDLLSRHYYYMRGLIPSDRYYDPLYDPAFEPTTAFNEADPYAMTLETFSVQLSNNGWEAADLYIKKNSDGSVPTDVVKTDYEGIKDFLTPRLANTPYIDKEINGVMTRTFRWKYAATDTTTSIPMVLELHNAETGNTLYREFTYTPAVIDHDAKVNYTIYRSTEYKIPINRMRDVSLGADGHGSDISITNGAGIPVAAENNDTHVTFSYGGTSDTLSRELTVPGYVIRTIGMPTVDSTWGIMVTAETEGVNGKTLTLYPYNLITLKPEQFADYDAFDKPNVKISAWGDYPLYTHAFAGTRFAIGELENAWELSSIKLSDTTTNSLLDTLASAIYDHIGNPVFTDLAPTVTIGRAIDGNETVPDGKDFWFTIHALGNRDTLGEGTNTLSIPVYLTFTNPVIDSTKTLQSYITLQIINQPINSAQNYKSPTEILPGVDNHIVPDWIGLPYTIYGSTDETLNEGYFFGTELYSGGAGYKDKPVCIWNEDDHTADITMPAGPLTEGKGFRIFNKRTYSATASELAGSSLQDVVYYPYIDHSADEITLITTPKLKDFDFTNLDAEFFKGVRSTFVTLYSNKVYDELGWTVNAVRLVVHGTSEESQYIATDIDGFGLASDYLYDVSHSTTPFVNAPTGKEDYGTFEFTFVPANEGELTLTVEVTATYGTGENVPTQTYEYDITIDVKANEGELSFVGGLEPYWMIGTETFYLTELTGVTGDVQSKTMDFTANRQTEANYLSSRIGINTPLSDNPALAVTVKKSYTSAITTPKVLVGYKVILSGSSDDPRNERMYFVTTDIAADHIYLKTDIGLTALEFKPDVVFETMVIKQCYTERFTYNREVKGWIPKSVVLKPDDAWMIGMYKFSEIWETVPILFDNSKSNLTQDMTVSAPEGKYFYMPTYGGVYTGNKTIRIDIELTNPHFASSGVINLTYSAKRTIKGSWTKLVFDPDTLYIGQQHDVTGQLTEIPASDANPNMVRGEDILYPFGENKKYVTTSNNPLTLTISSDYDKTNDVGFGIVFITMFDQPAAGKVIESATWIRGYAEHKEFYNDTTIV